MGLLNSDTAFAYNQSTNEDVSSKKDFFTVPVAAELGNEFVRNLGLFAQRIAESTPSLAQYCAPDASRDHLAQVMSLFADRLLDRGSNERSELDTAFRSLFKKNNVSLIQQEKILRNPWFWVFQALAIRSRARAISADLEEIDLWFRTGQATPFSSVDGIIGEIFEYFKQTEPGMDICIELLNSSKLTNK